MSVVKRKFQVQGIGCAACVARIEQVLVKVDGIRAANIDITTNILHVEFDSALLSPQSIQAEVKKIGYDLLVEEEEEQEPPSSQSAPKGHRLLWLLLGIIAAFAAWGLMLNFPRETWSVALQFLLSGVVTYWLGFAIHRRAFRQLRHGEFSMDTLLSLSSNTVFLYSLFGMVSNFCIVESPYPLFFDSSAMIISIISFGKWLEDRAKHRAADALTGLLNLQPERVEIWRYGELVEVPLQEVAVDDILLVKTGQRIAVDGVVVEGSGSLDESSMTGEAALVSRKEGDKVFAGTYLADGALQIRAERVGATTQLGQMIQHVQEAQASKPEIQNYADKVASLFVPIILGIALLTFLAWGLFSEDKTAWRTGIIAAASVLSIACPCALGLATPTAIVVSIGLAARSRVLVKDAQGLQIAKDIKQIFFDKTGTLTKGLPSVVKYQWCVDDDEQRYVSDLLYTLELKSGHALAKAVLTWINGGKMLPIEEYHIIPGKGIECLYKGCPFSLGNLEFAKEKQVNLLPLTDLLRDWSEDGFTLVTLQQQGRLLLALALADTLRDEISTTISELQDMDIECYILSGDNEQATARVAIESGINIANISSGLLPSEKAQCIRERMLKNQGLRQKKFVGMLGDGINDALAITVADVSFAMASGDDISKSIATFTLVNQNLNAIPYIIRLSLATMKIIKQNFFWAVIYNFLAIPIAAGALYIPFGIKMHPMISVIAMSLSSLMVVGNSLRLRRLNIKKA